MGPPLPPLPPSVSETVPNCHHAEVEEEDEEEDDESEEEAVDEAASSASAATPSKSNDSVNCQRREMGSK
jgi:hypothetical protein